MKKTILASFLFFCLACSEEVPDSDQEMIGRYQLKAVLLDPGDGSGVFQNVQSSKQIELYQNGEVICHGDICSLSEVNDTVTKARWNAGTSTISSDNCGEMRFEMRNDTLDIRYPYCIEPCLSRYIKMVR